MARVLRQDGFNPGDTFPEKAPELWAYQSTILKAAHNYKGSNWVAFTVNFRGKCWSEET